MIEQERKVYRCGHCKKWYLQKHSCVRHELYCGRNPINHHACLQCLHLIVERETNDNGYSEKTFTCSKLDKQLHSFKAEKINHGCLGHTERMPLECPDFVNEIEKHFS